MDKKFIMALLLGVLVVVLVAFIDIQGVNLIGQDYTKGIFDISVWYHHLITALIIFSIVPICYFLFFRKDKSEAVGIYLVSLILFYFGLADILYFFLQGFPVPQTLPWLNNHFIISKFGEVVTNTTLYISVFVGSVIAWFTAKTLKEKL